MKVTINQEGNRFSAKVEGRLDTNTVDQFQKDIAPLLVAKGAEIEIDCSDLEYTSSQGLRTFLMLQKSANSGGGSMVLRDMKPQVKEIFDITGFSNIIRII